MDAAITEIIPAQEKRLNLFERYLTVWVGLCMVAGIILGQSAPAAVQLLRSMEFGQGSHVNFPIAVLIWLMIIPMMMKVDFAAMRNVGKRPRGLLVTLFVNWIVKPFSMAFLAWLFFRFVFSAWMTPADADQYIAGAIILAAAPCTAMVFVWSYLTDGDPTYTLVQVSVWCIAGWLGLPARWFKPGGQIETTLIQVSVHISPVFEPAFRLARTRAILEQAHARCFKQPEPDLTDIVTRSEEGQ